MPPLLALSLTAFLIFYSFLEEHRKNRDVSAALWIPFLWVALIGTRYASQWLNVGRAFDSTEDYLEGSPMDQAIFLALYAGALCVLIRRRMAIGVFLARNVWLCVFLAYCLISVLWSDYPWVALKRWIKVTEHVAMVLVVFSETNRAQAIDSLLRRFVYFSLAVSVLFIKYFPELGRAFDYWTGRPANTGVTLDKNGLGYICVLSIVFLVSSLLSKDRGSSERGGNRMRLLDVLMICFAIWLLDLADAKTALVCSLIGATLVVVLARSPIGNRAANVVAFAIACLLALSILAALFDIQGAVIQALGRDPTLTDRTYLWADVLKVENNPVVGSGFESFWLGPRAETLWRKYWWRPNQAHNGYIETFINLGAVGVMLLLVTIGAGFQKILASIPNDRFFGPIRFALLVSILILNYTDATFKAVHLLYFIFFLVVADYPSAAANGRPRRQSREPVALHALPKLRRPTKPRTRGSAENRHPAAGELATSRYIPPSPAIVGSITSCLLDPRSTRLARRFAHDWRVRRHVVQN